MSHKKTLAEFKNDIKKMYGNNYTVLGKEYITNKTPILIRHNICGYEYLTKPNNILLGKECPKCAEEKRHIKSKKTLEQFKEEVKITEGDNYTVLDKEYINNKHPMLIRHNICGYEYKVRPNDFQQGYRCPHCYYTQKESSDLTLIKQKLQNDNIKFIEEKRFKSLGSKRFDIYLPEFKLLIEFDGQQHFIVRKSTYFSYDMIERIKRDWFKNQWCIDHNKSLLRIPYNISQSKQYNSIINLLNENTTDIFKNVLYYYDFKNNELYNEKEYYLRRNKNYFQKYADVFENINDCRQ